MKLLYRMSEWHALAKLRMHTEPSLELMEECTKELGVLLRQFRQLTCTKFSTVELPREADARIRRGNLNATTGRPTPPQPNHDVVPAGVPPTIDADSNQNTSDNPAPTQAGKYHLL
jgi:hypothetical protein